MATSIQPRSGKFQLRVTHKLLPKPFFFTFKEQVEAENYRDQLSLLLSNGVVPEELLSQETKTVDPTLTSIILDYQRKASITDSDSELLKVVCNEVVAIRFSGLTFNWVEDYVRFLKGPSKNLAPGSIRKRIGALARVMDWYIKTTTPNGAVARANPLRMMPRGYSAYSRADAKKSEVKVDVSRNRRLSEEELARILDALSGKKREDRERPFTNDKAFSLLFNLIVDTGLRLFEAYRLTAKSFDFKNNIINVEGSKGHRGLIKPRFVPIKKELRAPLKKWCESRVGLIFPYWDGDLEIKAKRAATNKLSKRFTGLFEYAQVEDFTEHDLRHEAACRWFELRNDRGWIFSEIEVCKIMGWTDTRMAIRYASLRGQDLSKRLG